MIEEREGLSPSQLETFDHIVSSRGTMIRPFAAMMHRPEIARAAADLGAVVRYESTLSDHDRELVICTTAIERNCPFEWDSHSPIARAAGVSEDTLESIRTGEAVADPGDAVLVDFARELARTGKVSDGTFERALATLEEEGTVELAAIIGYYTMLAVFMNACDVC
jgi:4-carboxymuconolactone decarboxylase